MTDVRGAINILFETRETLQTEYGQLIDQRTKLEYETDRIQLDIDSINKAITLLTESQDEK